VLAAICYRLNLNLATTSLLFLLLVVAQALGVGIASSLVGSVVATGFLDYLFVQPVLTLRIADPFDAVALVVFLSTALIVSYLASKAQKEARRAEPSGEVSSSCTRPANVSLPWEATPISFLCC